MSSPIYLDYAATTPVDAAAAKAMQQCLTVDGVFANPASRAHIMGWQAEEKVETARAQVAVLLNCDPREIVWTSGATESNNLALKGVFEQLGYLGGLVTSSIEHKAVIDPANWLSEKGVEVCWLSPNRQGFVDIDSVARAINERTELVSIMHVNNETGSVNPIAEIGRLCREKGILLHVDAAQSAGKLAIDVDALNVDMLSLSAHKFYGPKGIGALYVKRSVQSRLASIIHGGGHERGMRSGTLPTHQLVGMGEAAKIAAQSLTDESRSIAGLRDRLWMGLQDLPGVFRNSPMEQVAPGHLNVCFSGLDGEQLMMSLRKIAISSGSACTSASVDPSYVLKAMGLSDADAHSSLRISLGRYTTQEDIDFVITHIRDTVSKLQTVNSRQA